MGNGSIAGISSLLDKLSYNSAMCGRYELKIPWRVIYEAYADFLQMKNAGDEPDLFAPNYNACPSQTMPILKLDGDTPTLGLARWGLIPGWTKGKPKMQPINAKCETAATSGMFRHALAKRRCLVPANGFYEWHGAKPPKQPYFIHLKSDPLFSFAGMWERWKPEENVEPIDTFTIVTTSPNELMGTIHNRMPVILDTGDYSRWLDKNVPADGVTDLLRPFDGDRMEAWKVSTKVNTPKNNAPDLSERVD